ncbi:hypothetical protein [Ruegeria arenilitoris]|uniref:hypothetical protein n=1 Tax=Ruegeria arenilitoris TaxID=1173585 RepID=UPI00147A0433|nr:hypothetical protein [Ruegeria arenilitoris]
MNDELRDTIETVAGLIVTRPDEGYEMFQRMLAVAGQTRSKTDYRKAVEARVAGIRGEMSLEKAAEQGRAVITLGGPNEHNELIREIGEKVAKRRLAVNFGGFVSVIESGKSAIANVKLRNADGNLLRDADGEPITEPAIMSRAAPMTAPAAHNVTLDACALFRETPHGPMDAPLPTGLSARMINGWTNILPPLKGIATFPVWHKGELLAGEGYHEVTRLWLQTNELHVTPFDTVEEAITFLTDDWLVDFPFASDRDRAVALMTPVSLLMSRTALSDQPGPPLTLYTAPSPGTGKSFLALVSIAAVTGRIPGSVNYSESEEEREKKIGAAILEGHAALFLDDLQAGSFLGRKDKALTRLITSVEYTGRILGSTKTFEGPAGIVPVATGNNIVVDGDMARRTLESRLEAPEDVNLALRTFRHPNIIKWTLDNRDRILGAYQTILSAHTEKTKPIGTFPAWAQCVAHPILDALGMSKEEFFQPWIEAAEEDAKGVQMKGAYEIAVAIAALRTDDEVQPIDGSWFTAAEIAAGIKAAGASSVLKPPGYQKIMDARELAFFLKRNAGSVYEGAEGTFRIQTGHMHLGKRTNWMERPVFRVKRMRGDAPTMPNGPKGKLHDLMKRESK